MDVEKEYERWLASPRVSEEDKKVLLAMDQTKKNDSFFQNAAFGTGGMRGRLGPGTNRINIHTIGRTTVGFGEYLENALGKEKAHQMGVAIAHDNRHCADEFTNECARILNLMGFKVYVFDALRPTPELSYAVRRQGAAGGIIITASHNPKDYNGYKVYDETGCQLVPSQVEDMLKFVDRLPDELSFEVPVADKKGETIVLGKEVDDDYIALVKGVQENPDLPKKDFPIVYSPQHGASYESAMRVFQESGYEIIPVKEQCVHDPDFGATKSPNPEVASAWELSLEYAKKHKAQLCLMTDPDGDRCGLAYLSSKGTYERLTGNQSAALLIDYLLSERKKKGVLPRNGVVYDTIVTSSMGKEIAASYGVGCESFLTGFKFIGNRIHHYEALGHGPKFVFGYEESYGCLIGDFARDKDGVQAILLYAEMALYHHLHGEPLDVAFDNLQKKYGYHFTTLKDIYFEGMEGSATMKRLMGELHERPFTEIAGVKVTAVSDYLNQVTQYADGKVEKIEGLPTSDVFKFYLEDRSTVCVRPSGTEPKVKFYIEIVSKDGVGQEEKAEAIYQDVLSKLGVKA